MRATVIEFLRRRISEYLAAHPDYDRSKIKKIRFKVGMDNTSSATARRIFNNEALQRFETVLLKPIFPWGTANGTDDVLPLAFGYGKESKELVQDVCKLIDCVVQDFEFEVDGETIEAEAYVCGDAKVMWIILGKGSSAAKNYRCWLCKTNVNAYELRRVQGGREGEVYIRLTMADLVADGNHALNGTGPRVPGIEQEYPPMLQNVPLERFVYDSLHELLREAGGEIIGYLESLADPEEWKKKGGNKFTYPFRFNWKDMLQKKTATLRCVANRAVTGYDGDACEEILKVYPAMIEMLGEYILESAPAFRALWDQPAKGFKVLLPKWFKTYKEVHEFTARSTELTAEEKNEYDARVEAFRLVMVDLRALVYANQNVVPVTLGVLPKFYDHMIIAHSRELVDIHGSIGFCSSRHIECYNQVSKRGVRDHTTNGGGRGGQKGEAGLAQQGLKFQLIAGNVVVK
jgi:hypothetical protein